MIKRSGARCCDSSMIARCNPCPCPKIMTWRTTRHAAQAGDFRDDAFHEQRSVELARARAERVQVQVADGADRLDAGERPEAIQQAPRVDARLVALALLTAGRELDPDLWVLETKTMDRHLALMRLPQQLSAFACRRSGCWRWHWPRSASTAWSATASPGGRARWAHSRFPGHALTPTGVMAIRCKQFHLPDL